MIVKWSWERMRARHTSSGVEAYHDWCGHCWASAAGTPFAGLTQRRMPAPVAQAPWRARARRASASRSGGPVRTCRRTVAARLKTPAAAVARKSGSGCRSPVARSARQQVSRLAFPVLDSLSMGQCSTLHIYHGSSSHSFS